MLGWLQKQFIRPQFQNLSLRFDVDRNPEGQFVVTVWKKKGVHETQVLNVTDVWRFGYQESDEVDGRPIHYQISDDDFEILQALRATEPEVTSAGELIFGIEPLILRHIRKSDHVKQTAAAETVRIHDKPLQPTARIDLDIERGLLVETGYANGDGETLIAPEQTVPSRDGRFTLIGDDIYPANQNLSPTAQVWLKKGRGHIPIERIPEFFMRDMVLLQKDFAAVLTDRASQVEIINERPKPVVNVDVKEKGWLDFEIHYEAHGVDLPLNLFRSQSEEGFVRVGDLTWARVDPKVITETEKELQKLNAIPTVNGFRVPATEFASLEEFIEAIGGVGSLSQAYQQFLDQLTGFQTDDRFRLPEIMEIALRRSDFELRPYQRAGIHWLAWLTENRLHGILADDMGLGKTLQTILMLQLAYLHQETKNHSLIISPRSVMPHWEREIKRIFPNVATYQYHGPNRARRLLRSSEPIIFLSTYSTVTNDLGHLQKVPLFYLILDEATYIKNPSAKRTGAIKALNAQHRLALSGTPVENKPAELWSLFDFLMRGHLGRYGTFEKLYENNILTGDDEAARRLGRKISPFLLRRTKQQVARDLPEKIEFDEWCSLTTEQAQLYGGYQDQMKQLQQALEHGEQVNYTASILPVLQKLKQICDHPAMVGAPDRPVLGRSEKFDWTVAKVVEIAAQGEQVVIFSHFLKMLSLFEDAFTSKNISYIRLDGGTNNRQQLIDQFNAGQATVALCSIQAVGYGINLTSANHVIHADRWWNPATEDQATDRVHRIGQDKTVYVYRIMVEGTLEERIDRLLANKRGMADRIVGEAMKQERSWTKDELIELLKPLDSVKT